MGAMTSIRMAPDGDPNDEDFQMNWIPGDVGYLRVLNLKPKTHPNDPHDDFRVGENVIFFGGYFEKNYPHQGDFYGHAATDDIRIRKLEKSGGVDGWLDILRRSSLDNQAAMDPTREYLKQPFIPKNPK